MKKKKEVYLSNSPILFSLAKQALDAAKVPSETKTLNAGTQSRRTGTFWGRLGEDTSLEIIYYLYVAPELEEKARFLIDRRLKEYYSQTSQ